MTTTSEYIQDCQAALALFQVSLTNLNASLTRLGITNITASPTVATTAASVAAAPIITTTG